MSRSSKVDFDWGALRVLAEQADAPLSTEELELWKRGILDGNARMWNVEYVHATQKALEGRDPAHLLAMLDASIPAPPFLLPAIAHVLRVEQQGLMAGRGAAFTEFEDHLNRKIFERVTVNGFKSDKEARAYLAEVRGVSVKTIERSLQRTSTKQD